MGEKRYPILEGGHQLVLIWKGAFHFKFLYIHAYHWVTEYKWESSTEYLAPDAEADDKFEEMYGEEHEPGPVRKIWIWWRLQKPDKIEKEGRTPYFKEFMNIRFLGFGVKNQDYVKDGKKMWCQKGELNVLIEPWIELDYKDKWAKHPILKHFHKLYKERIIKNDIEKREAELLKEAYLLYGMLKKTLELYTFGDERALYGKEYALEEL